MIDIFGAWREAINAGCVGLYGDEVCAGYYRIHDLSGFEGQSSETACLPVAIWWDEENNSFICLVDGHEANVVDIWPNCRSFPVSYEAYVHVAEQGGAWPDGFIDRISNSASSFVSHSEFRVSDDVSSDDLASASHVAQSSKSKDELQQLNPNASCHSFSGNDISPIVKSASADNTVPHFDRINGQTENIHKSPPKMTSAGLGHNLDNVPNDVLLSDTLSELERDCFGWLDQIGLIETQKQADQAGGFAERFSRIEKEAEETRTFEKRPILEQGRAIDAKWKPIVTGAFNGKKRMKRALEPFLIAERERLEAEASIKGDGADITSPKAGLHGRKISLRSSYVLSITNEDALRDYFAQDKRFWRDKDVRLILKRLAEADLHAGRDVPGAELVQELTAA
jgi:hypothetical protein